MGKGDKKTRRGKLNNGSYGVRRPRKSVKKSVKPLAAEKQAAEAPVKKTRATTASAKKPKSAATTPKSAATPKKSKAAPKTKTKTIKEE